jgi:hypothetical protein
MPPRKVILDVLGKARILYRPGQPIHSFLFLARCIRVQAASRECIEALIPKHLHYVKGWPTVMPTRAEAILLSEVRRSVADMMRIAIQYTEPDEILGRYAELMALNAERRKGKALPILEYVPFQPELWSA